MTLYTVEDIMKKYKLPKKYVYKLLRIPGCPVLPREKNDQYRVLADRFDKWLNSRQV